MLALTDVHAGYGASQVLHGVSLRVERGETVCLLGRNGAGKTTTLRTVMGLLPLQAGEVRVGGRDVTGWPAHRVARLGVGYVPEDRRIFPTLSVRDNLLIARAARGGRAGPGVDETLALFPKLADRRDAAGVTLSGGEQQMLTVARALMTAPELLLLDEPTEGLAPVIVEDLHRVLANITGGGSTVLLAEQNVEFVLGLSERAYVIDRGEIVHSGTVSDLRAAPEVLDRYLGVG